MTVDDCQDYFLTALETRTESCTKSLC